MRDTYIIGDMVSSGTISEEELTHKDVRSSNIFQTENNVKKILQLFDDFSNPFETDQKDLFCLSSEKACIKNLFW